MAEQCCLCTVNKPGSIPTTSVIIEALQQIIKALCIKEVIDTNKENDNELTLKKFKDTEDGYTLEIQRLSKNNKELNNQLEDCQRRSDNYKQKFLQAQEALITLHETNQKLAKQQWSSGSQHKAFPFETEKPQETKEPIVLAPDTCFAYTMQDEESQKSENFLKPAPLLKAIRKPSVHTHKSKENMTPSNNLEAHTIDPDETRMSINIEDDDAEYSIPSSPLLRGSVRPNGKSVYNPDTPVEEDDEDSDDGRRSPSLLSSARVFKAPTSKQSAQEPFSSNAKTINNDNFDNLNDSISLHSKKSKPKTLSPIRFDDFEEDSELEREMMRHSDDHGTSFDDIFNKTDGVLNATTVADMTREGDFAERHHDDNTEFDHGTTTAAHSSSVSKRSTSLKSEENDPSAAKVPRLRDSFHDVPKKQAEFKFQSVVRKKSERDKLSAAACPQCEAYYSDLPDDERAETIRKICRHRHEFLPPSTPEHFWEIGIPNTAECKRRGYMKEESDLPLQEQIATSNRRRRRKPYQAHFPTKDNIS